MLIHLPFPTGNAFLHKLKTIHRCLIDLLKMLHFIKAVFPFSVRIYVKVPNSTPNAFHIKHHTSTHTLIYGLS